MLILDTTNDKLQLANGAASELAVVVSYVDFTTTATTPAKQLTKITTSATTDILAAPAASTQRQVKQVTIHHVGSTSQKVTVILDSAGTDYNLFVATLTFNETITYTDADGWLVLDAAGRRKSTPSDTVGITGQTIPFYKPGTAADTIGYWYCHAKDAGFPGAWAPGAPGINGRTTDGTAAADNGCLPIRNPGSGSNYLANVSLTATVAHWFMLFDVLWVNTGIVVTTTTAQAIVSPAFPSRCADGTANGEGLMIGLLTTTANTNAAVISNSTVSYTNEAGTAGRTATLANLVGAQIPATPVIGTIVWFRLDAGDKGVRSIQSITLGTSLVAGAVSLLVARPLWSQPVLVANVGAHPQPPLSPGIRLYNGTCALWCYQASATTATTMSGTATIIER